MQLLITLYYVNEGSYLTQMLSASDLWDCGFTSINLMLYVNKFLRSCNENYHYPIMYEISDG